MNHLFFRLRCLAASLVLAWLGFSITAEGASDNAKSNAKPAPTTNSFSLEVSIPQSVFEYGAKGVKDPFFPLSTRMPHIATQTNVEPTLNVSSYIKLKGLSGAYDNRLALINNRTLAVGESAMIPTPAGKVKIHLIEIRKVSVVIRAEGQYESMEVFLPKGDQ